MRASEPIEWRRIGAHYRPHRCWLAERLTEGLAYYDRTAKSPVQGFYAASLKSVTDLSRAQLKRPTSFSDSIADVKYHV
jgi:hypothetical protein